PPTARFAISSPLPPRPPTPTLFPYTTLFRSLVDFAKLGEDARLAVPTPEHYLPLLYVAALQSDDEPMSFAVDGYDLGSVSMLAAESEEHTSELQSLRHLVCRLLLEKKKTSYY